MSSPRKINEAGLNLIKHFEGLRLKSYKCPAGIWTIGYGHTGKVEAGQVVTPEEAVELLKLDLTHAESGVECMVSVPLTDNQFSALVSLVFNIGRGHFKDSSLLKCLNKGEYFAAANWFLVWNRAGGRELDGLTHRRQAERELFLKA